MKLNWNIGCLMMEVSFQAASFIQNIDNKIGRIDATRDPNRPQSATGNVGPAKEYGWRTRASFRLNQFNLPNAIVSLRLNVLDSEILNPFINQNIRTDDRGGANIEFQHDITSLNSKLWHRL